ncbi:hypothetical protein CAEBREN_30268 [Caenorhabditis brenneri]|uniref:Uncharacterized protein n=1 Tax=Caenorhabditis brenneri TaxID=135651 RepID=G0MPB5_CAEBE|nr:hypothetical protein CAEBREN_30268 [Caenorhabditis brenneri]
MFFSMSYGVLEVHFIYRYIALCKPKWMFVFNEFKWILILVLGVLGQSFFWFFSIYFLMWPDDEMRSYLAVPFQREYNVDVQKIPLLGATYWGASTNLIIYKTLKTVDMSRNTRKMHRNLSIALAIQTFIPFAISYIPCMVAWIVPIIHVDLKG